MYFAIGFTIREKRKETLMKIKIKVNKATILKAAGLALGLIGSMIEAEERKIEINKAVQLYLEDKSMAKTTPPITMSN